MRVSGGGVAEREAHDVNVAAAGSLRGEGNCGIGLGVRRELRDESLDLADDGADRGVCRVQLVL